MNGCRGSIARCGEGVRREAGNGFTMTFGLGAQGGIFLVATLAALLGYVVPACGQSLQSDVKEKIDAVLVLDGSGSMRVTDPGRLRDEGAKLFLEFLKPGDRVAIVEFSGEAKTVRPLSPFERGTISAVASDVERVGNSGQFTDILAGLKLARSLLTEAPRADATPVIVLLSDGKLDPDPAATSASTSKLVLTEEFLPSLRDDGIKVHTLAFGDQVDRGLLAEIATATDGASWFTPTSAKIHESYAQLFLVVKNPQVLPLTSKGFKIDAGVDEATFYINREAAEAAISLLSPDGLTITAAAPPPSVRWFEGQKFDVVTILQPRPGDWRITGLPSSDSFATVLTNLKLITDWPVTANLGSPLVVQARLFENEKPVVLREMAGATRYAFEITPSDKVSEPIFREFLVDDGTRGDRVAHDGIFSHEVDFKEVGEYKLKVIARAPTFERSQQLAFRIKPRMVELTVESAGHVGAEGAHGGHGEHGDGAHGQLPGEGGDMLVVTLSPDAQGLRRVTVRLLATAEDKKQYVIPLEKTPNGFQVPVAALPGEGEYELKATLSGEMRRRTPGRAGDSVAVPVREESEVLRYRKVGGGPGDGAVSVVVVKAEKQASAGVNYLLILLVNSTLGVGLFLVLKQAGSGSNEPLPEFSSLDELKQLLATLEGRVELIEVDPNDPLFAGDADLPVFAVGSPSLLAESVAVEATAPPADASAEVSVDTPPQAETPAPGEEVPREGT